MVTSASESQKNQSVPFVRSYLCRSVYIYNCSHINSGSIISVNSVYSNIIAAIANDDEQNTWDATIATPTNDDADNPVITIIRPR